MPPSIEEFRGIVENGNITDEEILKIQEMQYNFANYSPEDQNQIQEIIREVISKATAPAKEELRVLSAAIDEMRKQERRNGRPETTSLTFEQHEDSLSSSELRAFARDTIRDTPTTRGNENLFRLQKYFGQIHQPGIKVDGKSGPQSIGAITTHILATQVFLRELGAKQSNGTSALKIDGVLDGDTQKAIKKYFGVDIRIPETRNNAPHTAREHVSEAEKRKLGQEIIGKPLTLAKIKTYQTEHNIGVDGVIGIETYGEMMAGKLIAQINTEIDRSTLDSISKVLEYATPEGANIILLRASLEVFKQEHKNDPDFEEKYGDFFRVHTQRENQYVTSPQGQAERERIQGELSRRGSDGRSTYRRIADGIKNGNLGEEVSSLLEEKGPMALILLAGAFIFGMIPGINDTKATNTWWKRLLIAGVALMNGDSIKDMVQDATGGGGNLLSGNGSVREKIRNAWETETNPIRKAFPNKDFLEATQKHFQESNVLGFIKISNIPSIISALRSGENIPSYISNIEVAGKKLTKEQIIVYLQSILEGSNGLDITYINEVFNNTDSLYTWTSIGIALAAIPAYLISLPAVVAGGLAIGGVSLYFGREWINKLLQEKPQLSKSLENVMKYTKSISDPELTGKITNIISTDTSITIERKITLLKELQSTYPSEKENISAIIEGFIISNTEIFISGVEKILQEDSLDIDTLNSLEGFIHDKKNFINTVQIPNEDTVRFLSTLDGFLVTIQEKKGAAQTQAEIQRQIDIRNKVGEISDNILAIEGTISSLEQEKVNLIQEQRSANAQRIAEIDILLAEIPRKILELENKKASEVLALEEAKRAVGNLEVQQGNTSLESYIHFLENDIARAIEIQGVSVAIKNNLDTLQSIIERVQILTDNSEDKNIFLGKIEKIKSLLQNYITNAMSEVENIFKELSTEDLDILKKIISEYDNLKNVGDSLDLSYGNTGWEQLLQGKQEEIFQAPMSQILGFQSKYETLTNSLSLTEKEREMLAYPIEHNFNFQEIQEFFNETIKGTVNMRDEIENELQTNILNALQEYLLLQK